MKFIRKAKDLIMPLCGLLLIYAGFHAVSETQINILDSIMLIAGFGLLAYYIFKRGKKHLGNINDAFISYTGRKVTVWFDNLNFFNIFLIWILIIMSFGFFYLVFSSDNNYLVYQVNNAKVKNLWDCVYFSFITATSTGYGDILPEGYFKAISISEVIFGFMMLVVVTSKLVSLKQDVILEEIYEISFNERLNRLRSSLIVLRQSIVRLIGKVEDGTIKQRDVKELYITTTTFENILNDIKAFFEKKEGGSFIKEIDPINTQLLFNSILQSFEKLEELIKLMEGSNIQWKRDITIKSIMACIEINENLFNELKSSGNLLEEDMASLSQDNNKVLEFFKGHVSLRGI